MVTHDFIKLLPFLFNMNTLVSEQSSPMTYANRFCVAMLAVFAYNSSRGCLSIQNCLLYRRCLYSRGVFVKRGSTAYISMLAIINWTVMQQSTQSKLIIPLMSHIIVDNSHMHRGLKLRIVPMGKHHQVHIN